MSDALSEYNGMTLPRDWICANCKSTFADHKCAEFVRPTFQYVGMSRVKNEGRWIAEVIEGALRLCSRLWIMDDHSTDNTVEVCERYAPQVTVLRSPFEGFNEARDKNWLMDQIMSFCAPEWILCVDGDEVLAPGAEEEIKSTIADNPDWVACSMKIVFLWNSRDTMRTDWVYGSFWRPSMFKPLQILPDVPDHITLARDLRFMATPFGRHTANKKPNLHCSSVPQRYLGMAQKCGKLLHLGYMERADRVRKLDFYTGIDWLNWPEDCYRHMCQGDNPALDELPTVRAMLEQGLITVSDVRYITDLPASIQHAQAWNGSPLLHSGPLTIEPTHG